MASRSAKMAPKWTKITPRWPKVLPKLTMMAQDDSGRVSHLISSFSGFANFQQPHTKPLASQPNPPTSISTSKILASSLTELVAYVPTAITIISHPSLRVASGLGGGSRSAYNLMELQGGQGHPGRARPRGKPGKGYPGLPGCPLAFPWVPMALPGCPWPPWGSIKLP